MAISTNGAKLGHIRTATSFYPTMTIEEICNLGVKRICKKHCALFLWVTNPLLDECWPILNSWGFEYKTVAFNWIKTTVNGKLKHAGSEICILATSENLKVLSKGVYQVILAQIGKHSVKPAKVRDRIVQLFGELPRIELFARSSFDGWDCFGDQVTDP